MTLTIAVLGAGRSVGRAVAARLAAGAGRVLAVDPVPAAGLPASVEVRVMDHRDQLLPLTLEGCDVVVHAAFCDDLAADPDVLYGANVEGTRNVLATASKAGASQLVVISTAMAYGAHPDNPLPLPQSAPLRANPGFAYGYQCQLAEELVADWAQTHPQARVTSLRLAPVVASGMDTATTQWLSGPRLIVPAGSHNSWQFIHPDDVAAAVDLVIRRQLDGVFNVAGDGWLSTAEVAASLGRRVLQLGQSTLAEVLRLGTAAGVSPAPPEVLPYLLHPWVVDNRRLRDHGWAPGRSNRQTLEEFAAHASRLALGRVWVERSSLRQAGLAAGAMGLVAVRGLRRWRARR